MAKMIYHQVMNDGERKRKLAEYMRQWYAAHPGYQDKYQAKYRADPKRQAAARLRAREWYAKNSEPTKKRVLAHYHATKVLVGRLIGEDNHNWKGTEVGYYALHAWVIRNLGKPSKCEHCGTEAAKRFEWANVDHKYRRILTDYIRLCTSCHRKHDYKNGLANVGGRRKAAVTK